VKLKTPSLIYSLVPQVGVAVDVARVASKNVHTAFMYDSRVVIPWGWRSILRPRESPTPTLFFDVETQQVVQHALAIVSTKHINSVFVSNHSVLGATRTHKLITGGHFSPAVNCLKGAEV
jgi:hypothetical protein